MFLKRLLHEILTFSTWPIYTDSNRYVVYAVVLYFYLKTLFSPLLLRNRYIHTFTDVFNSKMTFKLQFCLDSEYVFTCFKKFHVTSKTIYFKAVEIVFFAWYHNVD